MNYKECLNDFKGQAAAGVFSFLVPWPSELLFVSFFAINPRRQILEFPRAPWIPGPASVREGPPDPALTSRAEDLGWGCFSWSWALLWGQLCFRS